MLNLIGHDASGCENTGWS